MGYPVRRYQIPGPEWCRTLWTAKARELWEPRIDAIVKVWQAVELASVGVFRAAARQSIAPELLPEFNRRAAAKGFYSIVLSQFDRANSYAARGSATGSGEWDYSVALLKDASTAKMFAQAWDARDDFIMGDLLGFPKCCIDFYQRVWNHEHWMDTTWPMALNTKNLAGSTFDRGHILRFADTPMTANILLRWKGVRYVPHLPCSLNCEASAAFGDQFRSLLLRDYPREAAWMDELLNSPIEWSAYHGIGEIKHPLFKVSVKTDPTAERIVVQRQSKLYPERGERGNEFPYVRHVPKPPMMTHELKLVKQPQPDPAALWQDNGFTTLEEMQRVHRHIVEFVSSLVNSTERVLDFGCGNGLLVSQLSEFAVGVESDEARVKRAVQNVVMKHTTIQDFVKQSSELFGVVMIMPGRLLEMTPEEAHAVRMWLLDHVRCVVVYAYGDWLTKFGSLRELCAEAGMKEVVSIECFEGCSVGRWVV